MEPQTEKKTTLTGSFVRLGGSLAGTRHRMRGPVFRIGRDPDNDLVIEGAEAAIVSAQHLEIRQEQGVFCLYDLHSTNGTYVDGRRITETKLQKNAMIALGPDGPKFQFELEATPDSDLQETLIIPHLPEQMSEQPGGVGKVSILVSPSGDSISQGEEDPLKEAVRRARQARRTGIGGQTGIIMRDMLDKALHRSSKKFKSAIAVLAIALAGVSLYAIWTIQNLKKQKSQIDVEIHQIELEMQSAGNDQQRMDELIQKLDTYQNQALEMQRNLLYRLGVRSEEQDFIESEIQELMEEFGAEEYNISSEFVEQVRRFIRQYQETDRPLMERALGRARKQLETARQQLKNDKLPPDLAYMVLVESAFIAGSSSTAGTAGLWQFTAETARAYGLKVSSDADERLDARKSTQAAGRYIRELILDFGSGSSVMLALAAYNLGPGKVKRAVRTVSDPIKQRNFWYLYRMRALPAETRQYIPKTIAAIIVGRNPGRFGF